MPNVRLTLDKAGRGALSVDGADISKMISGASITVAAGLPACVSLDIGYCELGDCSFDGADLVVNGHGLPESVQAGLYAFLRRKYGQVDVTVLGDSASCFATKPE